MGTEECYTTVFFFLSLLVFFFIIRNIFIRTAPWDCRFIGQHSLNFLSEESAYINNDLSVPAYKAC